MPLDYRKVKDIYDHLASNGVVTSSLPEWSRNMNDSTGTDMFSAGLNDNFIKQSSVAVDRWLESTGLPNITKQAGAEVGALVGNPTAGANIGESLPRTAINFLPLIAAATVPEITLPALAATAALSGAGTYTQTGSVGAGVLDAATNIAMPGVAHFGEQAALKAFGGQLLDGAVTDAAGNISKISQYMPSNLGQSAASYLGGQASAGALGVMSGFGQQLLAGQPLSFSPSETALNLTLGQLPFAGVHLASEALGGVDPQARINDTQDNINKTAQVLNDKALADAASQQTPIEGVPDWVPPDGYEASPVTDAQTNSLLNNLRTQQAQIAPVEDSTNIDQLQDLREQEADELRNSTPIEGNVAGTHIADDTPRTDVDGTLQWNKPDADWRMIQVSDDPSQPEELRGQLVGYSTKFEPHSGTPSDSLPGQTTFSLPPEQYRTVLKPNPDIQAREQEQLKAQQAMRDMQPEIPLNPEAPEPSDRAAGVEGTPPIQPELPVQEKPGTDYFDHVSALNDAESDLGLVKNPLDFQQAIQKINAVRQAHGIAPLDDAAIAARSKLYDLPDEKRAALSALEETRRQVQAAEDARNDRIRQLTEGVNTIAPYYERAKEGTSTPLDQAVLGLRNSFGEKNSGRRNDIVTSGLFDQKLGEWEREGSGDIEALKAKFAQAIATGTGLRKLDNIALDLNTPAIDKIEPILNARETPEVSPIKQDVADRAANIAGTASTEDRQRFVELARVGALKSRDLATEVIKDTEGLDDFDARDEAIDFLDRADVKGWTKELDDQIKLEGNPNAKSGPTVSAPTLYKPETPEDAQWVKDVGTTGHSLYKWLTQPYINSALRSLVERLGQFGDSLSRIEIRIMDGNGPSVTRDLGNRRVQIDLSSNMHDWDDTSKAIEMTHELMHGLTIGELHDPSKAGYVRSLTQLRKQVTELLPPKLKAVFDKIKSSDWYTRYGHGEAGWSEAFEGLENKEAHLIYGLLNNHEFVAQGFTSSAMRSFLQKFQSNGRARWNQFTDWVKNVLKIDPKDTLLDNFLGKANRLMEQGNFVSTIHNYGDRYFENQGLNRELAQEQSSRLASVLLKDGSTRDTVDQLLRDTIVNPNVFATRNAMHDMFSKPDEDTAMSKSILRELGFHDSPEGTEAMLHELMQGDADGKTIDALQQLPQQVTDYLFSRAHDVQQVLQGLNGALGEKVAPLLNINEPEQMRGMAKDALQQTKLLTDKDSEFTDAVAKLQQMFQVSPDGLLAAAPQRNIAPTELAAPGSSSKEEMGAILKFLGKPAQVIKFHPELQEAVSKGYQLQANVRNMASQAFKAFGMDLVRGVLDKKAVNTMHKAVSNPKIENAVNKWIYWNQKKGGDSVTTLPESDLDVKRSLQGLSSSELESVRDLMAQKEASQRFMNAQILEKMINISAVRGARLIGPDTKLKVGQNVDAASKVLQAVMADWSNPEEAQQAQAQLSAIQQKMSPEAFMKLLKFSQAAAGEWKTQKQLMDANPAWSTAQRYGRFDVEYTKGGKKYYNGVNSRKEAENLAQGGQITRFEKRQGASDDEAPGFGWSSEAAMQQLRQYQQNQYDMLSNVLSPEDLEAVKRTSGIDAFQTHVANEQGMAGAQAGPRRLSKGAEELPYLSNHFSWLQQQANYWSRALFREQIGAERESQELQPRHDLQDYVKQYADNILKPDPEAARVATRFTTNWFMGFNVASTITNATQLLLRSAAELTSMTGRPIDSFQRTLRSYKEIYNHATGKGWATPEHEWVMKKAARDGELDLSLYDENAAANELVATNLKRAIAKNRPQTLGQRLGTAAGGMSTASMWMFRQVEHVNNTGAILSSYDHFRESGLTRDDAYAKALQFNHTVNDVGGRVNRPVGLFSGKDNFSRSAAMMANSMQSYMLGSTAQLAHYLKQGFFRPNGLLPHEVWNARKAATQMLATQFAAAGVLGLPFVSGVMALLDKAFPDLELNKHIREFAAKFFGSDEDQGNVFGDIAMTGLPSALGWDWQSRLSMGNSVPGVSEINGFQPQLLLGAPVNLISNFVGGAINAVQGNPSGVSSMLPPAVARMIQTAKALSNQQINDYKGRPLFKPTPGESLGIALGFQPKRLSDFNAASQIQDQTDKNNARYEGQFNMTQAQAALQGNFGTVRQNLLARVQADPNYDPVGAIKSIAQAATEQTFPRDLRNEGSLATSDSRTQLLNALNIDPTSTSEVARFQFQQGIAQSLGLNQRDNSGLAMATYMDKLRQANPTATRSQLRHVAEQTLRHPRTAALLQASQ